MTARHPGTIMAIAALAAGALSGCGSSSTTSSSNSTASSSVKVKISAPTERSTVDGSHVVVRGTVTPTDATVEVRGRQAAVGNGVFQADVALQPGKNTIDVIASAAGAAPESTSVVVIRKTHASAPARTVTTTSPPPPAGGNPSSGGGSWPSGTAGWTVILTSAQDESSAEAVASRARSAGLGDVGTLYSSDHSSLRPGYWVAYSGVLSRADAVARQGQARAAGFSDAYARFVSAS